MLRAADLPAGYTDIDPVSIGLSKEKINAGIFKVESLFALSNPQNGEFIYGGTTHLANLVDIWAFDAALDRRDALTTAFTLAMSTKKIVEVRDLPGSDKIGDRSAGDAILASSSSGEVWVDIIAFRRGNNGALLMVQRYEGAIPVISTLDIARKFDARIVEILNSGTISGAHN